MSKGLLIDISDEHCYKVYMDNKTISLYTVKKCHRRVVILLKC